ncbi:MAG: periplasmic heavy metal sensor [Gammaproteobacteria bacterium]|nr:periplasmic heavy metal sensor [Gammaproteobacteria bacterium]
MKPLKSLLLAASIAAVAVTGLSACGWRHHDENAMAERISSRVTRKLDLDDSQQANLDSLIAQVQTSRKIISADREGNKTLLITLLQADTLDQQSLLELISGKTAAVDNQAPAVVEALAAFTDSLSPQQREKLLERLQDKFDDRHWR